VAYQHQALLSRWRGNGAGVDYNWADFPNGNFTSDTPFDDDGHGTFTTGIVVGGDPGQVVGMAPLASWIACRFDGTDIYTEYLSELSCLNWM
jgi:subtilisin family serine protease